MAPATFKDLSIDAADPDVLARFWAAVLGRTVEDAGGGDRVVRGPTPGHTIWITRVPEPKTVKHRVHLDIYARSLEDLEQLGARVLDREVGAGRWTVMADPEGGEFCAFLRDPVPRERHHGLVVDSADPVALADWWARIYHAPVTHHPAGWATVENVPGMPIATFDFVPVPEAKEAKNRVHWDVTVDDPADLLAAGATLVLPAGDDRRWDVLADPEGNEFCAFRRHAA